MGRIAPWLAVVLAAAIAVVAVFEIDMRSDEGEVALEPTSVPSPSGPTTAAPTTMGPPTMAPTTVAPTERPAATATIESTEEPTVAPTDEPTAAPTDAPTPAATTTPPVVADPMPHTGGGAVSGGISVLMLTGGIALAMRRRR